MLKFKRAVALMLVLALVGCATIMHGGRQDIYVTSNPSGAVVRVNGTATTTPGLITLERKRQHYTLIFEKEGYEPVEVDLRRGIDGWFWGNLLIGGLIGIVIDFMTGAAYKLNPADVDVDLYEGNAHLLKNRPDMIVYVDMEYLKQKGIKVENLERIM